jgi:hypothetical protein
MSTFSSEPLCECSPKSWIVGVEDKVSNRRLPHSGGTIDFSAYCPVHKWLRIVDLKTGHGEVEAEGNPQCAIYGLHKLLTIPHPVSKVVIEIIQPRSPSGRRVKRWTLSPFDLLEWLPVFQRKVCASLAQNAPLVAGEKQCRYCSAAPVCPERRKGVTRSAMLQFGVTAKPTPEDTAEALDLVPQLKDWIKSVESFAYQAANSGTKIPGYKLVQKRDGNRKWADEVRAGEVLRSLDLIGVFEPPKLKSPAQMEKIAPKEVVNELCTREPGGTVLVEETDNRPAVVVDKLASFQNLLTK